MKKDLVPAVLLAVLALAGTWPLVLHLEDRFPNDPYDPAYCVWAMNQTLRTVPGGDLSGWADGPIFYPHKGTLFYADTVVGLALLGAPLAIITGDVLAAHNVLLILSFWIAGWGMYRLVRRFGVGRPEAFLAAVVFAFFPYNFSHIMHLELLFYGWMPFCLLFIHRLFDDASWKNVIGAALFFILQTLCCTYYAEYLALVAGALFLFLLLRNKRWKDRALWVRAAGLAALIASVLIPYYLGYARVHARMLFERPLWEVKLLSPELQDMFTPPDWNLLWGWLAGKAPEMEKLVYPGFLPLLLTAAWVLLVARKARAGRKGDPPIQTSKGLWTVWSALNLAVFLLIAAVGITGGFEVKIAGIAISVRSLFNLVLIFLLSMVLRAAADRNRRSAWAGFFRAMTPTEKFYCALVVVSWILALGPTIKLFGREVVAGPYALLYNWIPGFKGLRAPGRFVVPAVLGMSVILALAASGLRTKLKSRSAGLLCGAAVAAVLVLDYAFVPVPLVPAETAETVPRIYDKVKKLPAEAVLIELPMPAWDGEEHEDALPVYRTMFHGRRIVNGYSGYTPPAYRVVREAMERFPERRTFDLLENLEVEYLLVHTTEYRAEKGRETVERLKDETRRATLIAEMDGDFLYRLEPYRKVHEAEAPIPPPPPRVIGDRSLWKAESRLNPHLAGLALDG
ncbi:MAG: hypothetical protein JW843_09640, partial [Candidatus Aminicenantes bacterium]|nr:hypothetical protein [Candidatus Aminicenantes bacterium]